VTDNTKNRIIFGRFCKSSSSRATKCVFSNILIYQKLMMAALPDMSCHSETSFCAMHIVSEKKASFAAVIYKFCIKTIPKVGVSTQWIYSNTVVLEFCEHRYLLITLPEIQGRPGHRGRGKKRSNKDDFIYRRLVLEKISKHEVVVFYCSSNIFFF
jgi:hypothetical protein